MKGLLGDSGRLPTYKLTIMRVTFSLKSLLGKREGDLSAHCYTISTSKMTDMEIDKDLYMCVGDQPDASGEPPCEWWISPATRG